MTVISSNPSDRSQAIDTVNSPSTADQVERQRFHRGVLFSLLRYGISLVTGFGYWMLSTHLLGAAVVGLVSLMTSVLGMFRPISSLGEQFALIPALNQHKDKGMQAKTLFWIITIISGGTTLFVSVPYGMVAAHMLDQLYHQGQLVPDLWVYLIGFYMFYNLILLFGAPFLAFQELKFSAYSESASGLARMILLVILVYWVGPTPMASVISQTLAWLTGVLVLAVYLPKVFSKVKTAISSSALKKDIKGVYAFSLKSLPATASISVLQHADRLILGYFVSPAVLGVYALSYALFERVLMMGTSYEDMMFSSASRGHHHEAEDTLGHIYRSALIRAFFWGMPMVVILTGFSHEILLLFGKAFTQGAAALSILLLGIVFDIFGRVTTGMIGGLNKPSIKALIVTLGALTNLGTNFILIPRYGIVGAATANTLGYIVTAGLSWIWVVKCPQYQLVNVSFWRNVFILLGVNSGVWGGIFLINHFHPLAFLISGILCGFFYWIYYQQGRQRILASVH